MIKISDKVIKKQKLLFLMKIYQAKKSPYFV